MLYVDDLLIIGNDIEKIKWIKKEVKQTFEMINFDHLQIKVTWCGVQDLFTKYIHDSKNIRTKNIERIWNDE
jgi:hypothetical protein